MKPRAVAVPAIQEPIRPSPGFEKKLLSTYKLDILALCGFGCSYCSSNEGNYLRINRAKFADIAERQLGERVIPSEDPALTIEWPDVITRLAAQLAKKPKSWGAGHTLVFSMLTDGFSPRMVTSGTTERALRLVLDHTSFRVRVLTKNAIVGSERWVRFFGDHPGRFVVGLSTGTTDDGWASRVELGTSAPTGRLRALRHLQDAGVPTYGMLCPVFPDMMAGDGVERLVERVRPDLTAHVWAEPFNDRGNWRSVRDGYEVGDAGRDWMEAAFDGPRLVTDVAWSRHTTELYLRLRRVAERDGWLEKLRYLLYEGRIVERDAVSFAGLDGVLLQGAPTSEGKSANPWISAATASDLRAGAP